MAFPKLGRGVHSTGCLVMAALACAAGLPGPAGNGARAQTVSPLVVKPPARCLGPRRPADLSIPAPRVVSTFPAEGAVVRPGLLVVRLTFNVAMSCDGVFLTRPPLDKPCSGQATQEFVLSYDRLTLWMICTVARNTRYGLRLNYDPAYDVNRAPLFDRLPPAVVSKATFRSLAGRPLERFELTFSTSAGPEITTQQEALAEDAQAPVQREAPAP